MPFIRNVAYYVPMINTTFSKLEFTTSAATYVIHPKDKPREIVAVVVKGVDYARLFTVSPELLIACYGMIRKGLSNLTLDDCRTMVTILNKIIPE